MPDENPPTPLAGVNWNQSGGDATIGGSLVGRDQQTATAGAGAWPSPRAKALPSTSPFNKG